MQHWSYIGRPFGAGAKVCGICEKSQGQAVPGPRAKAGTGRSLTVSQEQTLLGLCWQSAGVVVGAGSGHGTSQGQASLGHFGRLDEATSGAGLGCREF